jgi:hypothetical protein
MRGRILAWLAEGAREVTWALCSLPRERWAAMPPTRVGDWPALRHVRHLVLSGRHITLPRVEYALTGGTGDPVSTIALEQADAAWDSDVATDMADELLADLASVRFELLQRLEVLADDAWTPFGPASIDTPPRLTELLLRMRQHELEHLTSLWRLALYWDRVSTATPHGGVGLVLHPADRLEESH